MYPEIRRVCGLKGNATPAQIEFAKKISKAFAVEMPTDKSKQAYGDFIAKNSAKYKKRKVG